jgi:hypothetical protein
VTVANSRRPILAADTKFFAMTAVIMAILNIAAFSFFAVAGISTFKAAPYVHIHAVLFMGWVLLFVTQAILGAAGSLSMHRKLGWIAVGWAVAMVIVGTFTTVWTVQKAGVPFFFLPAQFLVMNPLSVLLFATLLISGVIRRRDREWHPRLIICGMAAIMGPALGRLLPAPLFMYSMLTAVFIGMIAFPLAGIVRDKRRYGHVHPAWWVGLVSILTLHVATETLGRSPIAASLYSRTVAGTPGERVPALVHEPPPF